MCSGRILVYVTETPPKQQVGFGVEIPWFQVLKSVQQDSYKLISRWWLQIFCNVHYVLPYLGKIPMLTHVFCVCKQICFKK